jgi:hypothetical protein
MATGDKKRREGSAVEELAHAALEAFRTDAPRAYEELVKEYEGQGAVVGIFGMGSVDISVRGGEVQVGEGAVHDKRAPVARAATYPETILAMSNGEITPLEAFHAGELVVRAPSEELHKAFGYLVKYSDVAIGSKGLQRVLARFKEQAPIE